MGLIVHLVWKFYHMTKPPIDMTPIWVRDEKKDLQQLLKTHAKRNGMKAADLVRFIIEDALLSNETSFVVRGGRKNNHNGE